MPRTQLSILCALVFMAGGCYRETIDRGTTTSQELSDLDRARSAGAVSEAEYTAIRAGLTGDKRP
jgi:hypothetical protein